MIDNSKPYSGPGVAKPFAPVHPRAVLSPPPEGSRASNQSLPFPATNRKASVDASRRGDEPRCRTGVEEKMCARCHSRFFVNLKLPCGRVVPLCPHCTTDFRSHLSRRISEMESKLSSLSRDGLENQTMNSDRNALGPHTLHAGFQARVKMSGRVNIGRRAHGHQQSTSEAKKKSGFALRSNQTAHGLYSSERPKTLREQVRQTHNKEPEDIGREVVWKRQDDSGVYEVLPAEESPTEFINEAEQWKQKKKFSFEAGAALAGTRHNDTSLESHVLSVDTTASAASTPRNLLAQRPNTKSFRLSAVDKCMPPVSTSNGYDSFQVHIPTPSDGNGTLRISRKHFTVQSTLAADRHVHQEESLLATMHTRSKTMYTTERPTSRRMPCQHGGVTSLHTPESCAHVGERSIDEFSSSLRRIPANGLHLPDLRSPPLSKHVKASPRIR